MYIYSEEEKILILRKPCVLSPEGDEGLLINSIYKTFA